MLPKCDLTVRNRVCKCPSGLDSQSLPIYCCLPGHSRGVYDQLSMETRVCRGPRPHFSICWKFLKKIPNVKANVLVIRKEHLPYRPRYIYIEKELMGKSCISNVSFGYEIDAVRAFIKYIFSLTKVGTLRGVDRFHYLGGFISGGRDCVLKQSKIQVKET